MYDTREEVLAIMDQVWLELRRQTDGLSNALDWRASPDQWSARQVLSHLGGAPGQNVLAWVQRVLREDHPAISVVGNDPFMTPERQRMRLPDLLAELEHIYGSTAHILRTASPGDLARQGLFRFATRPEEERTPLIIAGSSFDRHWRAHAQQLAQLREDLGLSDI